MSTITGSNERKDVEHYRKEFLVKDQLYKRAAIDVLPDEVLLEIFCLFLVDSETKWCALVHVCGRWRQVVFASPRRLNLRVTYSGQTPVEKTLDVWPTIPIVILDSWSNWWVPTDDSNLVAALQHSDRVCQISIAKSFSACLFWEEFAAIRKPFPALTFLDLSILSDVPAFYDLFLGLSAPALQSLRLSGISFPGLPNLFLSAYHLVRLDISSIPDLGYNSPEALATCLCSSTSLKEVILHFQSPRSCTDQTIRRPPLLTCPILPALTYLDFKGTSEYLEGLVAQIDAPLLTTLSVQFFSQQHDFDTPLLRHLISRTEAFKTLHLAKTYFLRDVFGFVLGPRRTTDDGTNVLLQLMVTLARNPSVGCRPTESSLGQLCTSCLPPLPTLESLKTHDFPCLPSEWKCAMRGTQWMELFRPFVTVQSLYLDKSLAPSVACALRELSEESVTILFPVLQNIFVQELRSMVSVPGNLALFVTCTTVPRSPGGCPRVGWKRAIVNALEVRYLSH